MHPEMLWGWGGALCSHSTHVSPPICSQLPPPRLQALLGRWRQKVFALLVQLRVQDESQQVQVGAADPHCNPPPHICGGTGAVEGHTRDNKDLVGTMGIS